ncbi:MAG: rRNA maturation RNase YbeY [Chitinophagaceae bacterium]
MPPETFTIFGNTMSVANTIQFHYLSAPFPFVNRRKLKFFFAQLLTEEEQTAEAINIIFCTDAYLLKMNQDYLKHNTYTDVITFQLSNKGVPLIADIYISVDRVKANAVTYQTSFNQELHRVMFHGLLHLCGYTDKTISTAKLIKDKEDFYLRQYFVSREIDL